MSKENKSTTIEAVKALFNQDLEYQKAERLVSPYYELAAKIINLRAKLKLTQEELAKKAETYQSRISKIESGEHDIRLSTLTKIAEALQSRVVIDIVPVEQEIDNIGQPPYKFLFPNARIAPENTIQFSEKGIVETKYINLSTPA